VSRRFDGRDDFDDPDLQARLGRSDEPVELGSALDRFIHNLGAPPISILTRLEESWGDLVGPALAGSTRPIELVDGVLTVGCAEAAWAAQVGWMEAQIRARFDELFEPGLVQRVATRVDR
jgi:hypothetical protein